jgi:bacteriocin-like protein
MAKPDDVRRDANSEKRELTIDELNAVSGGAGKGQNEASGTQQPPNSDRRKSGLDSIQKFLDIIRGMNPQI